MTPEKALRLIISWAPTKAPKGVIHYDASDAYDMGVNQTLWDCATLAREALGEITP